jgi:hypothetical protein
MNHLHFKSRHSAYTRPAARDACSEGGTSSEESQQLSCSPLTSNASGDMNVPTPLGSSNTTGNTSRTKRVRNQMVLVERAPEPLPSSQSIPRRPTRPRHHHPMSPAPILWMPVLIPDASHPTNTDSGADMSERTDAKKGVDKNASAMAEVINSLTATNVSMVAAMEDRNSIARVEAGMKQQDADLRKYSQFLEVLKNTNLSEDRRNKLEAHCSKYEETM